MYLQLTERGQLWSNPF